MIELAKGIHFSTKEEVCCVPNMEGQYEAAKKEFDAASKNIVNGYVVGESDDSRFKYYFEINIDSSKVWDLFWDIENVLFAELDEIYCVYGLKDEEAELSDYKDKSFIKKTLEKYKFSIVNDGFLSVGIAFDKVIVEEVFIESYKYLKVYTSQFDKIVEILGKYDLKENPNLRFIDEFIVASESMADEEKGIPHADTIVEELRELLK